MELEQNEVRYLTGDAIPSASSVLTSTSRFLNNARFRDVFAQEGLRRYGTDLPDAYLVPDINRAIAEETDLKRIEALIASERERLPEFAAWLDTRFVSNWSEIDLSGFPEGSVGSLIRTFMLESGMDIDFMFKGLPKNDFEYLTKRRVQNHDIEHLVTGFDTSPVGEIGLIVANAVAISEYFSAEFAQVLSLQPMFLASTSLMRTACHYPAVLPALLEAFALAHNVGMNQARPMFMIRWEDHLDKQVELVREELGMTGGPGAGSNYWDWTVELSHG